MSGTSADGINVALVRVSYSAGRRGQRRWPVFELLAHTESPYPGNVRRAVLAAMNAASASVADLSRLNFLLGELYAGAVLTAQRKFGIRAELVGCHGQTIYHQGDSSSFLGRKVAATWQTGEGAVVAARVGVPVVSDFRPADMAVGGKGAPLVPFLDYLLYRDERAGRLLQNIGGIGNLTALPAGARPEDVIAFDTGPGNMVIDALMEQLYGQRFDRDGRVAANGRVLTSVVTDVLRLPFFRRRPPKTAGREEFGHEFVAQFMKGCGRARKQDIVATATALTAQSIALAVRRFVLGRGKFSEFVVAGGGARNRTLMSMLSHALRPLSLRMRKPEEFGVPAEAKEAVAVALLAFQTWNRQPSNIPSATGAKRPAVLGKISYG
jgi:anhydro-N-acetylmuramic acid kinase